MKTQYLFNAHEMWPTSWYFCCPEENNTYSPFTRFCVYDHHDRDDNKWGSFALDSCVQGVTITQIEGAEYAGFCVISAEGDVSFFSFRPFPNAYPETGIHAPDSKYFGADAGHPGDRRQPVWPARRPAVLQAQPLRGRDLALPRARPAPAARNAGLRLLHHAPHQRSPRARGLRRRTARIDLLLERRDRPKLDCPVRSTSSTSTSSPTTRSGSAAATATCSRANTGPGSGSAPGTGLGTTLFQRMMTMYDGTLYLAASGGDRSASSPIATDASPRSVTGCSPRSPTRTSSTARTGSCGR